MSRPSEVPQARTPQRRNGKLRVAAILKAGAAVIAEKGYEAATMAEIAARSSTKIGSLYRFFPNKEVLANALIAHYHEGVHNAFDELDSRIQSLSISALADFLLDLMVDLHKGAGPTMRRLLEIPEVLSVKRGEFSRSRASRRVHRGKFFICITPPTATLRSESASRRTDSNCPF